MFCGTSLPWMVDLLGMDSALSCEFAYRPPASAPHLGKKIESSDRCITLHSQYPWTSGCRNMLHWCQLLFHGILLTWFQYVSWIHLEIISFWPKHWEIYIYIYSIQFSLKHVIRLWGIHSQSPSIYGGWDSYRALQPSQHWPSLLVQFEHGRFIQQHVFNVDELNVDLSWCICLDLRPVLEPCRFWYRNFNSFHMRWFRNSFATLCILLFALFPHGLQVADQRNFHWAKATNIRSCPSPRSIKEFLGSWKSFREVGSWTTLACLVRRLNKKRRFIHDVFCWNFACSSAISICCTPDSWGQKLPLPFGFRVKSERLLVHPNFHHWRLTSFQSTETSTDQFVGSGLGRFSWRSQSYPTRAPFATWDCGNFFGNWWNS